MSIESVKAKIGGEHVLASVRLTPRHDLNLEQAWNVVRALRVKTDDTTINLALASLASLTTTRADDEESSDIRVAAYREKLRDYPPDVVTAACKAAEDRFKFWPTWGEELKPLCDEFNRFRELLFEAMNRLKTPQLAPQREITDEQRALNIERLRLLRLDLAGGCTMTNQEIDRQARENLRAQQQEVPNS